MKEAGVTGPVPVELAIRVGFTTHGGGVGLDPARAGEDRIQGQHRTRDGRHLPSGGHQGRSHALDGVVPVLGQRSLVPPRVQLPHQVEIHQRLALLEPGARQADRREHARDQPGETPRLALVAQKILIDDAVWGFLWYDSWTRVMKADLTRHREALGHLRAVLRGEARLDVGNPAGRPEPPGGTSCMGFGRYVLQRLLLVIPTLIGVTLIAFTLTYLLPGNPASSRRGRSPTPSTWRRSSAGWGSTDPCPSSTGAT